MPVSLYLARFFGFFFIFVGLMWITKRHKLKRIVRNLFDNPALVSFCALFNVMIGLILVLLHNHWAPNWTVLVTIMSYLILIRGLVRTFFPDVWQGAAEKVVEGQRPFYIGSLIVFIGLVFIYLGHAY